MGTVNNEVLVKAKEAASELVYMTPEELQKKMSEEGKEFTLEEATQMKEHLTKLANGEMTDEEENILFGTFKDGELTDEDLEGVSGGREYERDHIPTWWERFWEALCACCR